MSAAIVPAVQVPNLSPMMRQYQALRAQTDAILAYQMGDFFEFLFDDAHKVSRVLGICLSQRGLTPDGLPIAMCGFPLGCEFPAQENAMFICASQSQPYFLRLAEFGFSVAVAMQCGLKDGMMQRRIIGTLNPPIRSHRIDSKI